ncbi:MAG: sigma-70 family RNA polymerase sigma factor [Pseudomonadota bacterium]
MTRPDPDHFQRLLHEHRGIVLKVAASYAPHAEDRRDLAQEIALQAWRSFGRYDPARAKFSTWLYRVALNVAISHLRRGEAAWSTKLESLDARQLDTVAGEPVPEPDERIAELHAFIARLDPLNRALIVLYLDERSYAEIAEILGISETNVATKISRVKQTLRGRMAAVAPTGA